MSDDDFEEQLRQETIAKVSDEDAGGNTYTDADGTMYEWDAHKKAWFPKIDDDFIARYQMNYGVEEGADQEDAEAVDSTANSETYPDFNPPNTDPNSEEYYNYYYEYFSKYGWPQEETQAGEGEAGSKDNSGQGETTDKTEPAKGEKRPANRQEGWFEFDTEKGTHVYVSGLPTDITLTEFTELMQKYGLIVYDHHSKKPKIKLYSNDEGQPKGDGLCVFIKPESVDLCLNILDGSDLRGSTVHVERARFAMKGNYDPSKKKKKLSNKEKRKLKEKQEKLFGWNPEQMPNARLKHEKIVVLKNLFDPHDFDEDPALINEVVEDVRSEAARFGVVKKVTIYDQHADGVLTVSFKEPEMADACIEALNGRFFAKRRILASQWDGRTSFQVEESETEKKARLDKWAAFLEGRAAKQAASAAGGAAAAAAAAGEAADQGSSSSSSEGPSLQHPEQQNSSPPHAAPAPHDEGGGEAEVADQSLPS